jgi:DNA-directed RNA polymerase specialized sigma subunit
LSTEYLNNKIFEEIIIRFQYTKRERTKYQMFIDDVRSSQTRGRKDVDLKLKGLQESYSKIDRIYCEAQEQLAIAFLLLAENIVKYAKFNLIDMYDAIQEGVMICFEKIDRFDPIKGKAFNYMTTCILNHYRQLYRTARNYNEFKKKYHDFLQIQVEKVLIKHKPSNNKYYEL